MASREGICYKPKTYKEVRDAYNDPLKQGYKNFRGKKQGSKKSDVWVHFSTSLEGIGLTECLLSHISDFFMANSWINEPITGMFVLISMYYSWWFQIWSWNSTILTIFYKMC